MTYSQFSFLQGKYPKLYKCCEFAEVLIQIDPSSSIAKCRLFAEKMVELIWSFEGLGALEERQLDNLKRLYKGNYVPVGVKNILHLIRQLGNAAIHKGESTLKEAEESLFASYKLAVWFVETYDNEYIMNTEYEFIATEKKETIPAFQKSITVGATPLITERLKSKTEKEKNIIKLQKELDTAPLLTENLNKKVKELNHLPAVIQERRKRSKDSAKRLDVNSIRTVGILSSLGLMFGPVGLVAGATAGVSYFANKYRKTKREN